MLAPGDKLGPYEILDAIGAGGMGEVYRARDPRLRRTVAIKVSREQFSDRFAREARAVAALNHPNICQVYDVGPNYLVMEYVEGAPPKGPLPLRVVLDYARQIAAALETAHDKGIVHRDLKPANTLVTPDGNLKVLDFGLAKMGGEPAIQSDNSPTFTIGATQAGMIMGTAAYMAPEQARGKPVDKRADIWAFGVVIYELVTGAQLFPGDTASDSLASVLKDEPDWSRVPPELQPLLRRCLAKDLSKRLRDIGDAMALVEAAVTPAAPAPVGAKRSLTPWIAAGVLGLGLATLALVHFREPSPPAPQVVRFRVALPDRVSFSASGTFSVSLDGRHVALSAVGPDGRAGVWIQDLDATEARPLPGAQTGPQPPPFFWSHDSRNVYFSGQGYLKKVDIQGGIPQTVCENTAPPVGGSASRDGVIVFGSNRGGLSRVPAAGGTPVPLTALDLSRAERAHQLPSFLSDNKRFLYLRASTVAENSGIYVGSLDVPPEGQSSNRILASRYGVAYMQPHGSEPGWILFQRDQTVYAQRFDESRLALVGDPVALASGVGAVYETGFFSLSENGVFAWRPGGGGFGQLYWIDRAGVRREAVGEPANYTVLRMAPDGSRVVASIADSGNAANTPLWIVDLATGGRTRLTFEAGQVRGFTWSADGKRIAYDSDGPNTPHGIYVKPADGSRDAELLFRCSSVACLPSSWSNDGRSLLFTQATARETRGDLWVLPMDGDRKPYPLLATNANESAAAISPDGRWFSYASDESGSEGVYVRPFPAQPADASGAGPKWLVSSAGGHFSTWRSDGRQLAYVSADGVNVVDVTTHPVFSTGRRQSLLGAPPALAGAVSPDLTRTLLAVPVGSKSIPFINVVLNWPASIR